MGESILLSMLAWRNHWAENHNFNGVCPELILSTTAHPAFDRACSYYGIKMVKIEAEQDTQKVCPKKVRAKVNSNTVGIIASAPQYPHGIYDPVEELAEITREIMTLAKKLGAAAQKAPGLTVFPTECQTVAFTSKKYNIFKVFEKMNNKGWSLQALQRPPAIHIGVTYFHVDKGDEFVKDFERDLVEICTELMKDSSGEMEKGSKAATLSYFYGMSTAIKGTTAVEKVSKEYINAYYSTK